MTKRLEVVNLSNWQGEDFEIEVDGKRVVLHPGEHCTLSWGREVVQATATPVKNPDTVSPQPIYRKTLAGGFKERTVQVFPELAVLWMSGDSTLKFLD